MLEVSSKAFRNKLKESNIKQVNK